MHGVYPAARAAALAGMPLSTLHYWARQDIVAPRASASRPKLWSYEDLMALRAVVWLRSPKRVGAADVPRSSMHAVRRALASLRDLGLDVWSDDGGSRVCVDARGRVFLRAPAGFETTDRQLVADVLDLLGPFEAVDGRRGPDLVRPRPHLRIIPGKLSGAPHVEATRIETEALGALAARGFGVGQIAGLYPSLRVDVIDEAVDLERQLGTAFATAA